MAATTTRRAGKGKTAEERAAEVEALAAQLNTALAELTHSESWLAMLQVSARFSRYSANNVLLLWMQAEQRGVTLSRRAGGLADLEDWKRSAVRPLERRHSVGAVGKHVVVAVLCRYARHDDARLVGLLASLMAGSTPTMVS